MVKKYLQKSPADFTVAFDITDHEMLQNKWECYDFRQLDYHG